MQQRLQGLYAFSRRNWPSLMVIAIGAALQLFLITRPFDFLLTNLLPDDAFYYFEIARHIVSGNGSVFDGIHLTNGYHPLWMVCILPIYVVLSIGGTFDIAPIYGVLSLSLILNTLTACMVFRIVADCTDNVYVRAVALMAWILNPYVITESLNGLETSLSLFTLLLFSLLSLRAVRSRRHIDFALAGVAGGIMVLARLDLIFFVGAIGLYILFRERKNLPGPALSFGLPALLLVGGWLLVNAYLFDMFLTSASKGAPLVNHALIVQDNGTGALVTLKATAYSLVTYGLHVLERTGASWLLFVAMGMALILAASGVRPDRRQREVLTIGGFLFFGFALLFLVNAGVRFTGRSWYFISFNLFFVMLLAWTLGKYATMLTYHRLMLALLSVALVGSFSISWYDNLRNQYANHQGMLAMAEWMNAQLPPATTVGVFNAGIQGYFSHVTVVNLDGLVNNSAYAAMERRELWSYIQDEDIAYISDFDLYLTYRYKSFFDTPDIMASLEEVHRIPMPGATRGINSIAIYRVGDTE